MSLYKKYVNTLQKCTKCKLYLETIEMNNASTSTCFKNSVDHTDSLIVYDGGTA